MHSARMWSLISAVQVLLPGVLLISLVVYGAVLARDGRIGVGQLVTVYSAATLMLFPLRHFEEIAMAYSFSRPSAQRAVRVLSLHRTAGPSTVDGAPTGALYDPATGLMAPAGLFTAVVCGDPDEAGRLAERLGGHAQTDSDPESDEGAAAQKPPPSCSVAYRWTNSRWTPPGPPYWSRTRTRFCSPAPCASCWTSRRPAG